MNAIIHTIGHSTHSETGFIALLKRHDITAVADVRSAPYSRFNPQFNKERLKESLVSNGIEYVFLGKELGARSEDPDCYEGNKVIYSRLAKTGSFQQGIQRLREGSRKYRIALMCAEKDPLNCHRTILVGRQLFDEGFDIQHILADGTLQSYEAAIEGLIESLQLKEDMFSSKDELINQALDRRSGMIAYTKPEQ